jgi:hypothetical protein
MIKWYSDTVFSMVPAARAPVFQFRMNSWR